MTKKIATKGTKTTTGGQVLDGIPDITLGGQQATVVGMQCSCKSGRKCCKGIGKIVAIGANPVFFDGGQQAALQGYQVMCGCPDNFICEPSHSIVVAGNNGSYHFGKNIHFGENVEIGGIAADPMKQYVPPEKRTPNRALEQFIKDYQEVEAQIKAKEAAEAAAQASLTPTINPDNEYWPPYDFTKPEGEKEIKVNYTDKPPQFVPLAPKEWEAFFNSFDMLKEFKDTATGLYDAVKTAKALGGIGVVAVVKEIEGVEYVILKNYDRWKQHILYGGVFQSNNPQVIKLGLGALDSVKGMAKYLKVTAPMEIVVAGGINALQYILNDEYTLRKLGVEDAKLFVDVFVKAGSTLIIGLAIPEATATVVTGLVIMTFVSATVWAIDQWTDFEAKLIEKGLEVWDELELL